MNNKANIPSVLYDTDTNKPFTNCIECECELLYSNTTYLIEKVYKRYPNSTKETVLFEFAICYECAEKLHSKMSVMSKQRMLEYFSKLAGIANRNKEMFEAHGYLIDGWISKCVFKEIDIQQLEQYHLVALCQGEQIIYDVMPYMISDIVEEEIQELLSEETKEEMDDFTKRHFGLPDRKSVV